MKALVLFKGVEIILHLEHCSILLMDWYYSKDRNFKIIRYYQEEK